ncbi:MAG: patatin family protein [Methanocorpusculum sp.]|nr:patatin family protein [Methanocorpusculum sp.]
MSKTGLVVEGGGMKCAYNAGILDKFLDDNITFDYCIGTSAGAGNIASYIAGQRDRNLRFYTTHIIEPEYCGLGNFIKHGSYFNLQYVYGTLSNSNGSDAFDIVSAKKNPAEFTITATDAETGKVHYFTKDDLKTDDLRVIMATCAIPAMCKPIEIDGRKYFDGGVSDSIPIEKAIIDGCEKIVVLLSNPRSFYRMPQNFKPVYHFLLRKYPKIAKRLDNRHTDYRKILAHVYELEKEGKIFVFAPSKVTGVKTSSSNPDEMQKLYELGLKDYEAGKDALLKYLRV